MRKLLVLAFAVVFGHIAHTQTINGGGGSGGGSGTVTSVAAGCGVTNSPSPITSSGTVSASITSRTVTGATDTILAADCGNVVYYNSASAIAVTQPAPSGSFAAGFFTTICNKNSGTATVTPASGTIGGASTYALLAGTAGAPLCTTYQSDGTNFNLIPQSGGGGITALTGDCTASGSGSVATTCNAPQPGYLVSNWYRPLGIVGIQNGTALLPGNTVSCYYGTVPRTVTIEAVGYRLQTASAGGNFTLALYTNSNGRPASLITSIGSQSTTTTGTFTVNLASNKQIGPGGSAGGRDIWFCANADNGNTVYETPTQVTQDAYIGDTTLANFTGTTSTPWGISCNGATACGGATSSFSAGTYTWPASLSSGSTWTTMTGSGIPVIWFEVASSP